LKVKIQPEEGCRSNNREERSEEKAGGPAILKGLGLRNLFDQKKKGSLIA